MTSSYAQPSTKRQKVREGRVGDSTDYFQGIDKLEYCGPSGDSFYRYYNSAERALGRAVDDWLKVAVSVSTVRYDGSDNHGRPTFNRLWDDTTTLDHHRRCLKATFDLCTKLGVRYWCGFDSEIVPEERSWEETAEFVQEQAGRTGLKPLWIAPDLHSHSRYASGAFTSNEASTYTKAAAQIKRCLDMAHRLHSECFLLWPHRDTYDSIYKTDVSREMKLFAKLLKITIDYKEKINYRGQLLIMPYDFNRESNRDCNWEGRYMWDVMSCLYFLRHFGLERSYKVVARPGKQMVLANAYNMLGGVTISNDCDPQDCKKWALLMRSITKQGAPLPGGFTLATPPHRAADPRGHSLITATARYIDALARGLRTSCRLEQDQTIGKYLQQKYSSYYSGCGGRLAAGEVALEECDDLDKKSQQQHNEPTTHRTDLVELTFQSHLDNVDIL